MATGGGSDTDRESFDLYECSVCLDSLINKEPRLLHCGHTFCTPCLQRLASTDKLCCPKCRKQTALSENGVSALPKNTDIGKMKEREKMLSTNVQAKCQMCLNSAADADYFCIDCRKVICNACEVLHTEIDALKSHHLVSMKEEADAEPSPVENCKIHNEERNLFCLHCEEAICVLCLSQHIEHKHHILELDAGMKAFRRRLDVCYANCAEFSELIQLCGNSVEKDLKKLATAKNELSTICEDLEEKLLKMKTKCKEVESLEESLENIKKLLEGQSKQADKLKKEKIIINTSPKGSKKFVSEAKDWHKRASQLLAEGREIMVYKYKVVEYKPGTLNLVGSLGDLEIKEASLKNHLEIDLANEKVQKSPSKRVSFSSDVKPKEFTMEKPKLVLEIKPGGDIEMNGAQEVISVGDGTILLVDTKQEYVQRINKDGKLIRKYYVLDKRPHIVHIVSASVYNGYIFVAARNVITKMPLNGSGDAYVSRPKVKIVHITAHGKNSVLISEASKIQEYNTETKQVIQKVSDIDSPGKICVVNSDQGMRYIVSKTSGIFKRSVKIYDRLWKPLHSIVGWMWEPRGLTVTPSNRLLVADYYEHRINEYTIDGHKVKPLYHPTQHHHQHHHHHHLHLFGSSPSSIFKSPCDIAYCSPYMWVLKDNPHSIQMYLVDTE